MIHIALTSDAKILTEIALKSKAFWGYSDTLIESWREDLTVTSIMIAECTVCKFIEDDKIAGFYILNPAQEDSIELEMLFVLPNFIGKGIGKQLLQHSFNKAKNHHIKSMILLADPNAVPFYTSQGFYQVDKRESAIPNRFLPVMRKDF